MVSNKSLLDFCILFENSENEFHPEGELEDPNYNIWTDFNLIDFKNTQLENSIIKNEIRTLFDKKRLSNLDDFFEEMFNANIKDLIQ